MSPRDEVQDETIIHWEIELMTMFCVVVVYLQDSSCPRALRFYSARAVPQEIYEMPSLTERSHKASLERLLVQFSYSWQREYYNIY